LKNSCTISNRQDLTAGLIEGLLEEGLSVRTIVTGRSMSPAILSGDTVTISPVGSENLNKGDIVLIRNGNGRLVLHRIIHQDKSRTVVRTKGDSLNSLDPATTAERILGRVTFIERNESTINTCSPLWRQIGLLISSYGLVKVAYTGMSRRLGIALRSML